MAEWAFGHHDTSSAMIVVKVGEGIGAGIVIGGRLYAGDDFGAGEIGHTRVIDDGERCRCGSTGCLETVASLRAVLERAIARSCRARPGIRRSPAAPVTRGRLSWPRSAPAIPGAPGGARRRPLRWGACWEP